MDRLFPISGPFGPISIGWRGRWNARHSIGAANIHSLSAWRFAPAIQRMQRTAVVAEKTAPPSPLIRGAVMLRRVYLSLVSELI